MIIMKIFVYHHFDIGINYYLFTFGYVSRLKNKIFIVITIITFVNASFFIIALKKLNYCFIYNRFVLCSRRLWV